MFKEVLGGPTTMEGITSTPLSLLHEMRQLVGESITIGLNDDEIIVINFNETKTNNIFNTQIKKQSFSSKIIDLNDYQLIHRYGNCYFLKK